MPRIYIKTDDDNYIPLHVIWGGETFRDRVDPGIDPRGFYRRLVEDPHYPTTSHATPDRFGAIFREALEGGADEPVVPVVSAAEPSAAEPSAAEPIVVITLSSALSGAFDAARQAAATIDHDVHVVDSKGTTMSLGWQVLVLGVHTGPGAIALAGYTE